jgi:hypothetical protein
VRYLGIEVNDALELAEQTRVIAGVEGRVGRRRRSLTGQLRSFAFPNGLLEAVIPVPNGGFPRETKLRERGGSADAQIPGSPAPEAVQDPHVVCDAFVSYGSQDAEVANAVVAALERDGLKCWIAPRDVTPGEFYADAIVRALNAAQVVASWSRCRVAPATAGLACGHC